MAVTDIQERIPLTGSGEPLALSDAPAIDGLVFRRFRGDEDLPVMLAILNACKPVDRIEDAFTLDAIKRNYRFQPNCDYERDMIFAEVGGEPAAYGRAWWFQEDNGPRVYFHFAYVTPQWRGRGLGRAILRWQEDHLRALAAGHDTDSPRVFATESDEFQVAKNALLERAGYRIATYNATMVRPNLENIPDLPLPLGVEVRPARPEHYRRIWEAEVEAFRGHWGFFEPPEEAYEHWFLGAPHFNPDLWKVAWAGDEVVGMVRSFIDEEQNAVNNRKRGWTENISVGRAWRRQGIAQALIALSLQEVRSRGMEEAALGVHTENLTGAYALYQKMGYEVVRTHYAYRKPME
jgi:ribosomal protein S18 acetylase RimI-like enzyme